MKKSGILFPVVLLLMAGMVMFGCSEDPPKPPATQDATWSIVQEGGTESGGVATASSTHIKVTFSKKIEAFPTLRVTISGAAEKSGAPVAGSGNDWRIPITVNNGGNATVAIASLTGAQNGSKSTLVYKQGDAADPNTYDAVADGTAGTTTSTKITFTFKKDVAELTLADITIANGTGAAAKGASVSKVGTDAKKWELLITTTAQGDITVSINKGDIEKSTKTVAVFKKTGEEAVIGGNLGNTTVTNNATQKGWRTNGTDNVTTNLDIVTLINAEYLELILSKKPAGGYQIIWQGDGNGWSWASTAISNDNGVPDSTKGVTLEENDEGNWVLKIKLADALAGYGNLINCYKAKFFIAYYTPDFDAMGIIEANLISTANPIEFVYVTFDADGGDFGDPDAEDYEFTEEIVLRVKKGDSLDSKFPANPILSGSHVDGWFDEDNNLVTASTPFNVDTKVTVKWEDGDPVEWTVSFDTDGGSAKPADVIVPDGSPLASKFPSSPTKADYIFAGWFDSDTMSTEYKADTPITEDITLKAKWTAIVYPSAPNVTSDLDDFEMTKVLKVDGGNNLDDWLIGKGNIVGADVAAIKAAKPNSIILLSVICDTYINWGFGTFGGVNLSAPNDMTGGTTFFVKLSVSDLLAEGNNATAMQYFVNPYNACSIQLVELWEPTATYVPPLDVFKNGAFTAGWSSDGTIANGVIEVTPTTGGAKPSYKITFTATTAIDLDNYKYLEVQWDDACDPHILQIGFNATWYGATAPDYVTTAEGLNSWQQKTVQHEIGSKFQDWSDNKTGWVDADKMINKLELFADFIQGGENWDANHDLTDSEVGIFSFKRVTFTKY
ncbi:MAG: InlB B-repeat-containing protein [Treponema sp.]|jgi:uncharacterized repeat protein (TIGR02543 family)|nr:InlB B-repeat-containing protein [Treponema sp.]